jgi:hypothetical protein
MLINKFKNIVKWKNLLINVYNEKNKPENIIKN